MVTMRTGYERYGPAGPNPMRQRKGLHPALVLLIGFICAEALLLILGDTVVNYHGGGPIQSWDNTVQKWWIDNRDGLVGASKVITILGDPLALAGISIVFSVLLVLVTRRVRALAPIVAYLGGEAMVLITRELVSRHRPPTANYPAPHAVAGVHEVSYSYPSDHALAAVAVVLSLIGLMSVTWRLWSPWLLGLIVGGGVATTRLVLGVNWFSDVAFGLAAGIIWGAVVTAALRNATLPFWPFNRTVEHHAPPGTGVNPWPGNRAAIRPGNATVGWPDIRRGGTWSEGADGAPNGHTNGETAGDTGEVPVPQPTAPAGPPPS